ncbi:MAG: thiol reductant ABC exporter subunit CydD [Nocardioides sp.]|uniref:thiol reductant ABC exporter subunit CydD n=1 Tax=Nocardioides sp. TaxID=35761 RepID=UPI0032644E2F
MRPSDPRLRQYLAPAKPQLLGVLGLGVLSSILVVAQAWAVTQLVLAVLGDGDGDGVTGAAGLVVAAFLSRALVGWISDALAASAAATIGTSLRRRIVVAVTRRHAGSASGEQAALVTRGVSAAEPYLTRYLPALVLASVLPPLTVVVIATQDLLSAGIVLVTLPLVPVFGALVGLATRDRAAQQWREMSSLSGHFLDVVRGLPTLVAYRRARAQSARIGEITDRYRLASLSTLRLAFASSAVLELVATLSVALVAVTVGVRLASGGMELGPALLVLLLAPEAYWPLRRVGAEFHAAAEGVATFEAVHTLLAQVPPGSVDRAATRGEPLLVNDLGVTYPGRTTPALRSVTTEIPATGVTVITGPSGCGKSTLLAAIAGLLEASSGSLSVGGRPIGGPAWQSQVAWLPQRPVFVAGTVKDNLRIAGAGASDERLWSVLRRVALEERVRAAPLGLDAPIGEDGVTLSAGERARLAMARVLLSDRPWTILDEPTAHLDELTEQVIADTIVELGRTGAVVVVAHRPAVIDLADRVVALTAPPAKHPSSVAQPMSRPVVPSESLAVSTAVSTEPVSGSTPGFAVSTLLGALASASGVALTATAGWLIVQASTHPAVLTLLVAIVGVRTFGLARPLLRYAERLRSHDIALRLLARRRVEVYNAIVPLTPGRLGRRRGDALTSIVDDVDSVADRELRVRLPLRTAVVVAAIAVAVAASVLWTAGIVVAISCTVAGAGGFLVARRGAATAERSAVSARADLSGLVVETIQIAPELVMWQATGAAADRVGRLSDQLGEARVSASRWLGAARAGVLVVSGLAVATMGVITHGALVRGEVSGPMMALLVLLPLALTDVFLPVADAGALAASTTAATARLRRLERTAPAVRDTVPRGGDPSTYDVDVDCVRARWQPAGQLTAATSLSLQPGERVALMGPSGSGKSTVAALMLRFLDPASGTITMGGIPTNDMALDDVRRLTGLVDDDPHVFATTLAENVRFARPGATDTEVAAALRQARLGDWLDSLPDGLATWLGDGNAQVSGGERARIAIARSLLAAQPVLVLDEPTAHLDHATATDLAREILSGPRSRTVLWITHVDPGVDLADRLIRLEPPRLGAVRLG